MESQREGNTRSEQNHQLNIITRTMNKYSVRNRIAIRSTSCNWKEGLYCQRGQHNTWCPSVHFIPPLPHLKIEKGDYLYAVSISASQAQTFFLLKQSFSFRVSQGVTS
jgi:hypothetical protein